MVSGKSMILIDMIFGIYKIYCCRSERIKFYSENVMIGFFIDLYLKEIDQENFFESANNSLIIIGVSFLKKKQFQSKKLN